MKRYVLDLSNLFSDHRQKVCIAHRDKWSTIRSLIHTLKQLFAIEPELVVLSGDGVYYPETENISILRDNETLKVLLLNTNELHTRSAGAERHTVAIDTTADHSQIEEIESILSSLPTPKRRRVRKRKAKQAGIDEDQASASKATLPKKKPQADEHLENDDQERIVPVDDKVLKHTLKLKQKQSEDELPYRNLNLVMKARVVRALSPTVPNPLHNGNHRTDEDRTSAEDTNNDEILPKELSYTQPCTNSLKPRVVRALSEENTVEVKQEQIEKRSNDTSSGDAVHNTESEANNSSTTPTLMTAESVGSVADETSVDNGEITIVFSDISL
ncbi:uncharacterized protein LOC128273667 [Anopheles cruzii]|uniref:uncharacterized protein LOC128273667 n=1 Tax=Anopheles cruzii TaxID=68878 RepID=UPI0022EC91AB|nr:uncharacterized protein LOC128273667 [Anopheles cruzii]